MRMPKDDGGTPIPALKLKRTGGAHKITVSGTTARNSVAFADTTTGVQNAQKVISLYSTTDCFIRFGDSSIVATTDDHFYPAGLFYDFAVNANDTHVAVIQATAGGTLYASERE